MSVDWEALSHQLFGALMSVHSCCEHGDLPDGSWSPLVDPAVKAYEEAVR